MSSSKLVYINGSVDSWFIQLKSTLTYTSLFDAYFMGHLLSKIISLTGHVRVKVLQNSKMVCLRSIKMLSQMVLLVNIKVCAWTTNVLLLLGPPN